MEKLLSTKEVADLLTVNEKMVYTLINEKGLPATKITGKWLFPKSLVEKWVESRTINYPQQTKTAVETPNLLLISGSNDILLDNVLTLYRQLNPDYIAFFANIGSLGGLRTLRQGLCHIATCHLDQNDYAIFKGSTTINQKDEHPAIVNFCKREQGLLVPQGNPQQIRDISDVGTKNLTIANRPLDSSTRLILDKELKKAGLNCQNVKGYDREFQTHLEIGIEILSERADTGLAIRPVASILGLDFIPLHQESYDLLIPKKIFFSKSIQLFIELLHSPQFKNLDNKLEGYDLNQSGKMIYPQEV